MSTKPETTQAKAPEVPWAVTPEKIAAAVKRIVEVGNPKKVILFGSAARGETHRDSDVDLLVVTGNEVSNPRQESVRLRSAVYGILMSYDIIVISESQLAELADVPGLIYREALREGKILYEAPV